VSHGRSGIRPVSAWRLDIDEDNGPKRPRAHIYGAVARKVG
jgi:hypothetical protein